jgi:hypothetical protein
VALAVHFICCLVQLLSSSLCVVTPTGRRDNTQWQERDDCCLTCLPASRLDYHTGPAVQRDVDWRLTAVAAPDPRKPLRRHSAATLRQRVASARLQTKRHLSFGETFRPGTGSIVWSSPRHASTRVPPAWSAVCLYPSCCCFAEGTAVKLQVQQACAAAVCWRFSDSAFACTLQAARYAVRAAV